MAGDRRALSRPRRRDQSVEPPAGSWERITEYFEGKRPRPAPDEAAAAVRALLQAAQVSRCRRNAEVIAILQAN